MNESSEDVPRSLSPYGGVWTAVVIANPSGMASLVKVCNVAAPALHRCEGRDESMKCYNLLVDS